MVALNELDAGGEPTTAPPTPRLAQRRALQAIEDACKHMGEPPPDLSAKDALSELQAVGYYDTDAVSSVVPLIVEQVSLPEPGSRPVPLADLLGPCGANEIKDFVHDKVLPKSMADARREEAGFKKPYHDPGLRDPRTYAALLRRLLDGGVVDIA